MSLAVIEVKNYIREVELSKKRRATYYAENTKIPKRYLDKEKYDFINGYLSDLSTKTKIIKNSRSVHKPRYKRIQGQDIWRGINFNIRSKIAKEMKKYFYEKFRGIPVINEYPIEVKIDFYDNVDEGEDLDNMIYFYRKCIHDALCGNVEFKKISIEKNGVVTEEFVPDRKKYPQIIIDDSKKYIQSIPTRFYPVDGKTEPSIVIELSKL